MYNLCYLNNIFQKFLWHMMLNNPAETKKTLVIQLEMEMLEC